MKLLKTIKDKDPAEGAILKERETTRAVIFDKNGLIPIIFVSANSFFSLPGGGIEQNEDPIQTIKREILEETGCEMEISGEVGKIIEYRSEYDLHQTSYCYYGNVISKSPPSYTQKELDHGFRLLWLTLDEAIDKLSHGQPTSYEGLFIQKRDLVFLEEMKSIKSHGITHPTLSYPREGSEKSGTKRSDIKPDIKVSIVLKKDQPTGKLTEGIVKDILTSSANHHRGIKVRLTDGQVGRVQEIK